jgi:hypothetical protein
MLSKMTICCSLLVKVGLSEFLVKKLPLSTQSYKYILRVLRMAPG